LGFSLKKCPNSSARPKDWDGNTATHRSPKRLRVRLRFKVIRASLPIDEFGVLWQARQAKRDTALARTNAWPFEGLHVAKTTVASQLATR